MHIDTTHTNTHTDIQAHTCILTQTHIHENYIHTDTQRHTHAHRDIHMHTHRHTHTYTHIHTQTHRDIHIHTQTHTDIHTHPGLGGALMMTVTPSFTSKGAWTQMRQYLAVGSFFPGVHFLVTVNVLVTRCTINPSDTGEFASHDQIRE